jgi:hypothetical protein
MKTIYQAKDGKLFNSKEDCLKYEGYIDINYSAKVIITFYLEDILFNADKREIEKGNIAELIKESLLDDVYSWGEALSKSSFKIEEIKISPSL